MQREEVGTMDNGRGTEHRIMYMNSEHPLPYAYTWFRGQIPSDSSLTKWNQFYRKNEGRECICDASSQIQGPPHFGI